MAFGQMDCSQTRRLEPSPAMLPSHCGVLEACVVFHVPAYGEDFPCFISLLFFWPALHSLLLVQRGELCQFLLEMAEAIQALWEPQSAAN